MLHDKEGKAGRRRDSERVRHGVTEGFAGLFQAGRTGVEKENQARIF